MKKSLVKEGGSDIKDIINRIRKRDFSGNTGLVVKNSIYQFSITATTKIGSLIFTIVLARLLMPELFGLYSLALTTILMFVAISNLGINNSLVRFVSREIGKNNKKAKAYLVYFTKIKLGLVFISIIFLIASAKFISNNYYQKPLFLALIAGSLYIVFISLLAFFRSIFQASNNFKVLFHNEIILQIARTVLVPLAVLLVLKWHLSYEVNICLLIIFLSLTYFLALLLIIFGLRKIEFLKSEKLKLNKKQSKTVNKFLFAMSATVLSGLFFGYIDMLMLGRFVLAEFIAYYKIPFSFIVSIVPLIGFSIVLLPVFSRLKGEQLKRGLKKTVRLTFILSLILFLTTFLLAPIIIKVIYGSAYNPSINILRVFSFLFLILPLINLYNIYIISQGKPQKIAKLLVVTTIINIILNYVLITSLLQYGNLAAVFGVTAATITSHLFYLGGLIFIKKGRKIFKKTLF